MSSTDYSSRSSPFRQLLWLIPGTWRFRLATNVEKVLNVLSSSMDEDVHIMSAELRYKYSCQFFQLAGNPAEVQIYARLRRADYRSGPSSIGDTVIFELKFRVEHKQWPHYEGWTAQVSVRSRFNGKLWKVQKVNFSDSHTPHYLVGLLEKFNRLDDETKLHMLAIVRAHWVPGVGLQLRIVDPAQALIDPLTHDEICIICREPLTNVEATLWCNHYFHYECINFWVGQSGEGYKCPQCRAGFEKELTTTTTLVT